MAWDLTVMFIIFKQFFLFVVIGALYLSSRDLLQLHNIQKDPWKRAIVDNLSHISLGVLSWLIIVCLEKTCQPWHLLCCLLCGFFAGFMDIDHFLMAKSFKLSDALNLPSRPPFHNTTLMLSTIICMILLVHGTGYERLEYIVWILLIAVISHHLRDSLHRGLWLWPAVLKPFSMTNCILLSYFIPLFIGSLMHITCTPGKVNEYVIV